MKVKKLVVLEWDDECGGWNGSGRWQRDLTGMPPVTGEEIVNLLNVAVNNNEIHEGLTRNLVVRALDRVEGREALNSTYGAGPGE